MFENNVRLLHNVVSSEPSLLAVRSSQIISLDRFCDQQDGVKHINAIDLFLGKEVL